MFGFIRQKENKFMDPSGLIAKYQGIIANANKPQLPQTVQPQADTQPKQGNNLSIFTK